MMDGQELDFADLIKYSVFCMYEYDDSIKAVLDYPCVWAYKEGQYALEQSKNNSW